MKPFYIGAIDIGGTKIAATIANQNGLLTRIIQPTLKTGPLSTVGEQAIALLQSACAQAGIDYSTLHTLGVSACGPFKKIDDMVGLATPNICGSTNNLPNDWTVIPLEKILRDQFSTVIIENDCVAALMAERTFGAVIHETDCVYVTWSTGIGFGLCVDGHILRGKNNNAGHAGHMLMDNQSKAICGCGNIGDVEALISGQLLCQNAASFPTFCEQNPDARLMAQWFGRALYNIVVTLDSRRFVIGGSVWVNNHQWLMPLVEQEIKAHLPVLTDDISIVSASLGKLVADIGALTLVMPPEWIPHWQLSKPWKNLLTQ
jgi:glucokinase